MNYTCPTPCVDKHHRVHCSVISKEDFDPNTKLWTIPVTGWYRDITTGRDEYRVAGDELELSMSGSCPSKVKGVL